MKMHQQDSADDSCIDQVVDYDDKSASKDISAINNNQVQLIADKDKDFSIESSFMESPNFTPLKKRCQSAVFKGQAVYAMSENYDQRLGTLSMVDK